MPHSRTSLCYSCALVWLSSFLLLAAPLASFGQAESPASKNKSASNKSAAPPSAPQKNTADKAEDAAAEQEVPDDVKREEEKERVAAERFLSVLEKNPRRGTSLDRVYGYHVERGSLDQWLQQYRDRTTKTPQDGTAWLLLGLIEAHRGQDAAAVKALQEAEKYLPDNALASFYLGQALILVDQPKAAAEALERAVERKPAAADLLDVFQALGRIYQRTQQNEKALDVWNRLEKLFPNDLRVQEQIAQTLLDEDQFQLALPRFEALAAKTTKDLYRKSQFQIQVAEIKVRLNKTQEALADFEKLLGEINPENWMYRDVRQKIDRIFLRTEDQAGLATYYTGWLTKHPDDIDAIVRLSRVLSSLDRMAESQAWLEKGLKLAPSRKDLRHAIIDQLVYDHKFAPAVQQYELLDKQEPNNPDTLRDWGRLILRDYKRPAAERRKAASAIWNRLVAAKPDDPLIISQVADLFRHADMKDEAIALYQKAVQLAPDEPQYREYLGEYFHQLKRREEALTTWRQIIAGKNRTAPNLARLSEVLTGFGYMAEGTTALSNAVALQPKDFDLRMKLAKLFNRAEKYDDSLRELVAAEKLAANPEESEAVLVLQLQNYQSAEKLILEVERLQKDLTVPENAKSAVKWYLLARFQEANRQFTGALESIERAQTLDPKSIAILATAAKLQEANNKFQQAAQINRQLALVDRRYRSEYLTRVAKLEARQGRKAEALQAGRDVIASAPGSPDSYEFFAQLCFQLGENDEGLETLRRAVRVNPSDPKGVLSLASALATQFKTAEAIDLYWRAFDRSNEIDDKLDVIAKLTELYLQSNQLNRLLERLDRTRRADGQQQRVMTLCVAQAHQSAGDYGTARTELERMLTPDSRDTQLIQQLAKLAELEGDYLEAAKYQAQLVKLAPSRDAEKLLARYLAMSGENSQANELIIRLALEEKDPERLLKSMDDLLERSEFDQAILILERLVQNEPRNWEFLYRYGVALQVSYPQKAEQQFRLLLDLNLPEETLSVYEQARRKQAGGKQPTPAQGVTQTPNDLRLVRLEAVTMSQQRDRAANGQMINVQGRLVRASGFVGNRANVQTWQPRDYREGRIAAFARLFERAVQEDRRDTFINSVEQSWDQNRKSLRHGLDWFYVARLTQNATQELAVSQELLKLPNPTVEVQLGYLASVMNVATLSTTEAVETDIGSSPGVQREVSSLKLSSGELDELVKTYKQVLQHPEYETATGAGLNAGIANTVLAQLRLAKRESAAQQLLDDLITRTTSAAVLVAMLNQAANAGLVDESLKLWEAIQAHSSQNLTQGYSMGLAADHPLTRLIALRVRANALPDVLRILDRRIGVGPIRRPAAAAGNTANAAGVSRSTRYIRQAMENPASGQRVIITTPIVDGRMDRYGFTILNLTRTQLQSPELTNALVRHFEEAVANKELSDDARLPWQVAQAEWQFCGGQHAVALGQLFELSTKHPDDVDLEFLLAQLYTLTSQPHAALNALEKVQTSDVELAQVRDFLILEAAVASNNQERARKAAEALKGQTLDPSLRQQVAIHMQRLGLTPPVVAMAPRVPRQANRSRLAPLIVQLKKLKTDGQTEQAVQVATSILQKTQAPNSNNPRSPQRQVNQGQVEETALARQLAIQVLKDSGKLKEIIERVEQQLQNSPNSIQLHSILQEYYSVAGNKAQAKEMQYRLVELNHADPHPRYALGLALLQGPDSERGLSMLKSAIRQQPVLLIAGDPTAALNAFQEAKKLRELARLLEDVDLAGIGSYDFVVHLINRLAEQDMSLQFAVPLLQRGWRAYPKARASMLVSIREQVRQTPEAYGFAKQLIFPESELSTKYPAWSDQVLSTSEGTITGKLQILLQIAQSQDKFDQLNREVAAALEQHPDWEGGRVAQAFLAIRRHEYDSATGFFEKLIDNPQSQLTYTSAWFIGQELAAAPKAEALAIRYYERAVDNPANASRPFASTPEFSLIRLHEQLGRKANARDVLLKAAASNVNRGINSQVDADRIVQNRYEIALALQKLGFVLDAISLYNELLHDTQTVALAQAYGQQYSKEARLRVTAAFNALSPDDLVVGLQGQLQQKPGTTLNESTPAIDLLLTFEVDSKRGGQLVSALTKVLKEAAANEKARNEINASLQQLSTKLPADVSVAVLSGLLGLYDTRPEVQSQAAAQVDRWLVEHPLKKPKENETISLQQRAQASTYILLWLVARECQGKRPLAEIGSRLAAGALDGGRLQVDSSYLVAMLREGGELAWDAGDKTTAETRWTELLDAQTKLYDELQARRLQEIDRVRLAQQNQVQLQAQVMQMQAQLQAQRAAGGRAVLPNPNVPGLPAPFTGGSARTVYSPPSYSGGVRYAPVSSAFLAMNSTPLDQCLDVAYLATDRQLHTLAFHAARKALSYQPVVTSRETVIRSGGAVRVVQSNAQRANATNAAEDASQAKMTMALFTLYRTWTEQHAPPDEIYNVLLNAVAPPQRAGIIQLYPLARGTQPAPEADDVGQLLIMQAIKVKKVDDLRQKLNERTESTSGDFLARLLLTKLALEMSDIPMAKTELAALSSLVERKGLIYEKNNSYSGDSVGSVALMALEHDELALVAQPLLMQFAKALMGGSRGSYLDRHSRIYLRLAKLRFDRGEAEMAVNVLDQYLKDQDEFYKSFIGKYERSIRQRGLLKVSRALADASQWEPALKRLGEAADMWQYDWTGNSQDSANAVVALRAIASRPAAERYQMLKAWTMPVDGRGTLRTLDVFEPDYQIPGHTPGATATSAQIRLLEGDGSVSSLVLLVQAARDAKQLEDLQAAVQPFAEKRIENAGELRALIDITLQKTAESAADLDWLILQARARMNAPVPSAEPPWSDYHVACVAMADPQLRAKGQQLCRTLIEQNVLVRRPQMLSHLRYYLGRSVLQDHEGAQQVSGTDPGLKWWRAAVEETAEQQTGGQVPAWWLAHGGLVSHICGPDKQSLYFRYPLEGTYSFSVDAYSADLAQGNVGFAGLIFNGARDNSGIDISPVGFSETLRLPSTVPFADRRFNHMTIEVQPEKLRYFVNQTLVYEDVDRGHNSPWLSLCVDRSQQTVYRKFKLQGSPVIPREVKLFDGDRLEGWVASFYQELQPPRRMNGRQSHEDAKVIVRRDPNLRTYDWAAENGILHARILTPNASDRQPQSWLYYHRPLEEGDELTYEFYYAPGATLIHPALGRMALLLDPQGVRVHWITDTNLDAMEGISAENVSDQPDDRRGPANLPLLPDQWNTVRIQLQGSKGKLTLNNQLVYETTLDSQNSRQFGFYHNRAQTSGQVRNVVLKGNWPEQLGPDVLADLLAPASDQPVAPADRQARHAIIGDAFYQLSARELQQQASSLPAAERYVLLHNWVLPNDEHPGYRVVGDFTPLGPPPVSENSGTRAAAKAAPQTSVRVSSVSISGGDLVSPVYDLLATANELHKLPELQQDIDKAMSTAPSNQHARLALAALVSLSLEQWERAEMQLTMLDQAQQQLPPDAPVEQRWPAVLAAWQALQQRPTQAAARTIFEHAAAQAVKSSPSANWLLVVRHLDQQSQRVIESLDDKQPPTKGLSLRQWHPVAWAAAARRETGLPPSDWRFKDGELLHVTGGTEDWIYFQSPLRGSFDVACEVSSGERRDLQLHYGARYVGIASNLKEVDFGRIGGLMVSPQVGQPIATQGQYFNYKLTVRDGTVEVFVDGHKILDRYQSETFDSWLGIHAPPHSSGAIRNVRITGKPTIPSEIDLLANDRVEDAWRGDYYSHNGMKWREERGTLRSPKLPQEIAPQQTLLQYHRPLAEDGELEFDYYYEPGAFEVHPALDRMVMLLAPEGVDVHWITDLQYDQTGLPPDNKVTETNYRRGPDKLPLKPLDWNKVGLKLSGNVLTVSLNGTVVYERSLPPDAQRVFGLFHYANDTEARVRNLKYRGNWPKTLPALPDQELSGMK